MRLFLYVPRSATRTARPTLNEYWKPGIDPPIPTLLLETPAAPGGALIAAFASGANVVIGAGVAA